MMVRWPSATLPTPHLRCPRLRSALAVATSSGAIRGVGGAARRGDPVERQALHAASGQLCPPRTQRARIDTHPGNLRGKPAVFDLGTAVHHDLKTVRLGEFRRLVIAYAELHPNDARPRPHLERF